MLALKHTFYNLIICLKSLKLTYVSVLQKQPLDSANKKKRTERFNPIRLAINSKKILPIDSRIESILMNYACYPNKPIKNSFIFSKYLQSYLYTQKQQKNLYFKVYIDREKNRKYPIKVINLNIVYIIYRLMKSKHPIYIYNQIYKNL